MLTIGILSLQGCVDPHKSHIEALGCHWLEVKRAEDFSKIDGLILPGGESTTMLKLIDHFEIWDLLLATAKKVPYWGICAGSILMAKTVLNPKQKSLGLLDIEIERNAYGRQLESQETKVNSYDVSFIRAPLIKKYSKKCKVLAEFQGKAVYLQQGHHLVSTFHAELNKNTPSPFHKSFYELCLAKRV